MKSLTPSRRSLCLWFPEWPMQRRLASQPCSERSLWLLTERTSHGEFVRHANDQAMRRGIRVEMPVCEARSLVRPRDRLIIEAVQPEEDRKALVQLVLRCERYSFCIGIEEADRPECLLMDVAGIAHFFGGEEALAADLQAELARRRFQGRIAIAETPGLAWAAAHLLTESGRPVVLPAQFSREIPDLRLIESLPVAGLRLEEKTIVQLGRVGLKTIGQLMNVDRASLLRRFGSEVLSRLDQLTGRQPEFLTPCRPLPRYRVERKFEEGITHPEAIRQLGVELLRELLEKLHPHRCGTRQLHGEAHWEGGTSSVFDLRLCEATGDFRHLSDLLRYRLERLPLTFPLIRFSVEALQVGPLHASQQEFFEGEVRDQDRQVAMLLNRLGNRLGDEAVVIPELVADPIPERAVRFRPVSEVSPRPGTDFACRFDAFDRPPVLFSEPRPLEALSLSPEGLPAVLFQDRQRFKVAAGWGPERIESGWWQAEFVCRDYYRVETSQGKRWWVFQRLRDGRWFWQGEW